MADTRAVADPEDLDDEIIPSVWGTLKDKPNDEDIRLAGTEEEMAKHGNRPMTSRTEIQMWYLYEFGNSPMFNVLIALILPLFLAAMATHYGCEHEAEHGCDYEYNLIGSDDPLVVYMGSIAVGPPSFTFTMVSISGGLQAIAYIAIGALADYGAYQFYLFRITGWTASLMILVYVFLWDPTNYLFAGWWVAFQLVFCGLSIIFYNAYLPHMVENHWYVRRAIRNEKSQNEIVRLKQQLTDDISQYAYAIGYCGALIMVVVTVAVLGIMAETQYEQYEGYGITSGTSIESFDEQWLKKVVQIDMSFSNESFSLSSIQLFYDNMDIDGTKYGNQNAQTTDSFRIMSTFITKIDFWYNDQGGINALRFIERGGDISKIYGTNTTEKYTTMQGGDYFVFAGYKVYVLNGAVVGMDTIMLNEETGQFPSTLPERIVAILVFIWWNVFQFISFRYMKRRDGPPLPDDNNNPWTFSAKTFYRTIKEAKTYPNLFRYLICWFMFSDGLGTIATAAVLFATAELGFTSAESAIQLLIVMIMAAVGGVFFLWLQRKTGWDPKQMLLLHLCFFIAMPSYCVLGLIPNSPIGLVSHGEFYVFCFFYGINFGSTYSYARSVFVQMLPRGKEAEMFALFEITDKGSSWIGPLTTAIIANTLSIRWAMIYVILFFIIPMPILIYGVNLETGMKEAGRYDIAISESDGTKSQKDKTPKKVVQMIQSDTAPLSDEDETQQVLADPEPETP